MDSYCPLYLTLILIKMIDPRFLQKEQVEKFLKSPIQIGSFVRAWTGWEDVTATLTLVLWTAWQWGVSVPLQVATTYEVMWVITGGMVVLRDSLSKKRLEYDDPSTWETYEVYGRISEALWVYTLDMFYIDNAWVEQTYIAPAGNIDFIFTYNFDFARFPGNDAYFLEVYQDPSGNGNGKKVHEVLTVTGLNTVSNLTFTPVANTVTLFINWHAKMDVAGHFTMAGQVVTGLGAANTGYDVLLWREVLAEYNTLS